jgi:hypothetical protein
MIKMSQIAHVGLIWAVTLVGAAECCRADTIIQTFTNADVIPITYNFAADQFNPADGTLQSVTVAETATMHFSIDIVNSTDVDLTYGKGVRNQSDSTAPHRFWSCSRMFPFCGSWLRGIVNRDMIGSIG